MMISFRTKEMLEYKSVVFFFLVCWISGWFMLCVRHVKKQTMQYFAYGKGLNLRLIGYCLRFSNQSDCADRREWYFLEHGTTFLTL